MNTISVPRLLCFCIVGLVTLTAVAADITDSSQIVELHQLIDEGNLDQARKRNSELLSVEPSNPELLFLQALIADKSGDTDKAMALYKQLTFSHPRMLEPYNNLALHQASRGAYKAAIDTLEMAIQSDPRLATLYDNLTALYAQLASAAYRKALNSSVSAQPLELTSLDDVEISSYSCDATFSESVVDGLQIQGNQAEDHTETSASSNPANQPDLDSELTESTN